jgi:electron transfer flavoprotein beta subunit
LLALVNKEEPGLVMLGKQAIDNDNNQTGQMLAALWGRPQATFASALVIDGTAAKVTREVDMGLETIEVDLPAVVTTDLRLNEPRYVKLPNIMKAKKKPLEQIPLADLNVEVAAEIKETGFEPPQERQRGVIVDDVAGLVAALKDKGLL